MKGMSRVTAGIGISIFFPPRKTAFTLSLSRATETSPMDRNTRRIEADNQQAASMGNPRPILIFSTTSSTRVLPRFSITKGFKASASPSKATAC